MITYFTHMNGSNAFRNTIILIINYNYMTIELLFFHLGTYKYVQMENVQLRDE